MSYNVNSDGSVTFISDVDGSTQLQPKGQTQAQLDAAYTAFQNALPLAYLKLQKQATLDVLFNTSFDLSDFIRAGSATGVTAANIGTFLATITANYRTLRASITSAQDVATLNAINLLGGWPNNP